MKSSSDLQNSELNFEISLIPKKDSIKLSKYLIDKQLPSTSKPMQKEIFNINDSLMPSSNKNNNLVVPLEDNLCRINSINFHDINSPGINFKYSQAPSKHQSNEICSSEIVSYINEYGDNTFIDISKSSIKNISSELYSNSNSNNKSEDEVNKSSNFHDSKNCLNNNDNDSNNLNILNIQQNREISHQILNVKNNNLQERKLILSIRSKESLNSNKDKNVIPSIENEKNINLIKVKKHKTITRSKTRVNEIELFHDIDFYADKSLFLFSKKNKFRIFLFQLVENYFFDIFIISVIIINSVILSLGLSLNLMTDKFDFFDLAEYIFILIYTCESLFKIIAHGFYEGKKAYIRDSWSKVDFTVMVIGLLCLIPNFKQYKELKIFRTFRPLRSISFLPGLKSLVNTLVYSIKQFFHLFLLLIFFFVLYGTFGVAIWSGLYSNRCRETSTPVDGQWNVNSDAEVTLCGGFYKCPADHPCGSLTGAYDSGKYFFQVGNLLAEQDQASLFYGFTQFNNIGNAFLAIFQSATLEGWSSIMYNMQNGYNYYIPAIYFVSLVIIINYFVINFSVAIMMDSCRASNIDGDLVDYDRLSRKMQLTTGGGLTNNTIEFNLIKKIRKIFTKLKTIKVFKKVGKIYDFHKKWRICHYAYVIINQPIFDFIIYVLIIVNLGALAAVRDDTANISSLEAISNNNTYSSSPTENINYILVFMFGVESLLRFVGLGFKVFFQSKNNIFDLFIVIISFLEIILFKKSTMAILRVIRVYRLLSIFKKWKTVAIILKCITATIKEMGYYALLQFIMVYVFALVGMNFFKGALLFDPVTGVYSETGVPPRINYENMYQSMVAVFVLIIGDNWFEGMYYCLRSPKTSKVIVYFYFITVILLLNIIMMNLVIAFLVYFFEKSRKKIQLQDRKIKINEYFKKRKIKTSMSFSFLKDFELRKMLPKLEPEDYIIELNKAKEEVYEEGVQGSKSNFENGKNEIGFKKVVISKPSLLSKGKSSCQLYDMIKTGMEKQEKQIRDLNTDKLINLEPLIGSKIPYKILINDKPLIVSPILKPAVNKNNFSRERSKSTLIYLNQSKNNQIKAMRFSKIKVKVDGGDEKFSTSKKIFTDEINREDMASHIINKNYENNYNNRNKIDLNVNSKILEAEDSLNYEEESKSKSKDKDKEIKKNLDPYEQLITSIKKIPNKNYRTAKTYVIRKVYSLPEDNSSYKGKKEIKNKGKINLENKDKIILENKEKINLENKEKIILENKEKIIVEEKEKIIFANKEKIIEEEKEKIIFENKEKIIKEEKEKIILVTPDNKNKPNNFLQINYKYSPDKFKNKFSKENVHIASNIITNSENNLMLENNNTDKNIITNNSSIPQGYKISVTPVKPDILDIPDIPDIPEISNAKDEFNLKNENEIDINNKKSFIECKDNNMFHSSNISIIGLLRNNYLINNKDKNLIKKNSQKGVQRFKTINPIFLDKSTTKQTSSSRFILYISESSLLIFHRNWSIRKLLVRLANSYWFDYFMIVCIILSNIVLLLDTSYNDPALIYAIVLGILDDIFTLIFFIELCIKVISFGLIFDHISKINEAFSENKTKDSEVEEIKMNELILKMEGKKMSKNKQHMQKHNKQEKDINNFNFNLNPNTKPNPNSNSNSNPNNFVKLNTFNSQEGFTNMNNKSNHIYTGTTNRQLSNGAQSNPSNAIANFIPNQKKNINQCYKNNSPFKLRKKRTLVNIFRINVTKQKAEDDSQKKTFFSCFSEEVPSHFWQRAYMRHMFNIIDSIIIIFSILYLWNTKISKATIDPTFNKQIRMLRAMRAIRPLRMINKFTELKLVVNCLIDSVPAIANMILIGSFVFLVYAIIGLNLFHGVLGACSDNISLSSLLCITNNSTWTPARSTFDTVTSSFLLTFEMATTSGWYDIMSSTIQNTNNWASLYFVSFMLIGAIFVMNLSVTVIVDNFVTVNEAEEGITMITEEQREWVKAMKYFLKYKPVPNFNQNFFSKLRKFCFNVISYKHFNKIINVMILINVIIMCFRSDRDSIVIQNIESYVFYVFSFFFTLELIMKLIVYRKLYFIDAWNKFDFMVVIFSSLSILLNVFKYFYGNTLNVIPILIRSIRILRVFRLIKINHMVKNYFSTLVFLIPSLINIGSLILVIITVYSVIGMTIFGTIKYGNTINDNNNFKNFISSFVLLIRTTTGDNWNDSMHELAIPQPGCIEGQTYQDLVLNGPQDCGGFSSYVYFISFMIVNSMVIMNLFIAVVVDSFMTKTQKWEVLEENQIKAFFELWGKYDTQVNYRIEPYEFVLLMMELPKPLGIKSDKIFAKELKQKILHGNVYLSHDNHYFADDKQCIKILTKLNIEAKKDKIHIIDAIKLITKRAIIVDKEDNDTTIGYEEKLHELEDITHERFNKKLQEKFLEYHSKYEGTKVENKMSNLVMATRVIGQFIKRWRLRRKQKKELDIQNEKIEEEEKKEDRTNKT